MSRCVPSLVFVVGLGVALCACASRVRPAEPSPSSPEPQAEPGLQPAPEPEPGPIPALTSPVPVAVQGDSQNCELDDEPGEVVRLVGLTDAVDPAHAPRPTNESERLFFRQVYDTLVRVDCEGRVRPALARSWRRDSDGRTWLVTLREDAAFSDATPVTASAVLASWSVDGAGQELRPLARRLVETVSAVDDRSLAIVLRHARDADPAALAHTDLAIARDAGAAGGSAWPLGTRARVSVESTKGTLPGSSILTLMRVAQDGFTADASDALTFIVAAGDRRDLLDEGVDLMLTRDPAALEYAATLPQYTLVPLAWRQTRVFLTRGGPPSSLTQELREALAADAVRGEARGAREPFWWQTLPDCDLTPPRQPSPLLSSTGRIVYDADDAAARDVAERLVGLAGASRAESALVLNALLPGRARGSIQRAVGLTGEALAVARRRGNDAGYVAAFERRPLDPCGELQRAIENVEWLTPDAIAPLVDTRLQAILRRGRAHVRVEEAGGLDLWARPPER